MRLMTSRHAVHRLSSFDVTSCVTSYLQLVLVAKEMGWLLPRILTFLTSSPAVAAFLIGTEHPLFWRHKQFPPRKGKSWSDFYQSTIYILYITKRVWVNFQIVSSLVLYTGKWVFLSQSFNIKLLCEQCKFSFPTQRCIWLFRRNCNYDITPLSNATHNRQTTCKPPK